jgi:hypothetical protein
MIKRAFLALTAAAAVLISSGGAATAARPQPSVLRLPRRSPRSKA